VTPAIREFFLDLFTKDTDQAQAALYRHGLPGNLPKKKPP
jgi:hypothetical protein